MMIAELTLATNGKTKLVQAVIFDDIKKQNGEFVGPIKYYGRDSIMQLAKMIYAKHNNSFPTVEWIYEELQLNHNTNALQRKDRFNHSYPNYYDKNTCRYVENEELSGTVEVIL